MQTVSQTSKIHGQPAFCPMSDPCKRPSCTLRKHEHRQPHRATIV
jgi:hypothetical protein